jgi:hypothetical protein
MSRRRRRNRPQRPPAIHGRRFSETLLAIRARAAGGPVTLDELFELSGPQGHGFLTIFLILPFLQPIPFPGFSTVIGLILATIGVFVALDRPPWLPRRFAAYSVEPAVVLRLCAALEKLLARMERLIKPRVKTVFAHRWFRVLNGTCWVLNALALSLPLPIPFSNFVPAVVVLLFALGTMEEDFVVILLAWIGTIASAAFFAALVILPMLGWQAMAA